MSIPANLAVIQVATHFAKKKKRSNSEQIFSVNEKPKTFEANGTLKIRGKNLVWRVQET